MFTNDGNMWNIVKNKLYIPSSDNDIFFAIKTISMNLPRIENPLKKRLEIDIFK